MKRSWRQKLFARFNAEAQERRLAYEQSRDHGHRRPSGREECIAAMAAVDARRPAALAAHAAMKGQMPR